MTEAAWLWQTCPLGWVNEQLVKHRSSTDADVIEWLKKLEEFLTRE